MKKLIRIDHNVKLLRKTEDMIVMIIDWLQMKSFFLIDENLNLIIDLHIKIIYLIE